jgi:hypothetical protein
MQEVSSFLAVFICISRMIPKSMLGFIFIIVTISDALVHVHEHQMWRKVDVPQSHG